MRLHLLIFLWKANVIFLSTKLISSINASTLGLNSLYRSNETFYFDPNLSLVSPVIKSSVLYIFTQFILSKFEHITTSSMRWRNNCFLSELYNSQYVTIKCWFLWNHKWRTISATLLEFRLLCLQSNTWQKMPDNAVFENDEITQETGRNGMSGSKVIRMEPIRQQHGATVSFHGICYRVEQKNTSVCSRTTAQKEILMDLKWVKMSKMTLTYERQKEGERGQVHMCVWGLGVIWSV